MLKYGAVWVDKSDIIKHLDFDVRRKDLHIVDAKSAGNGEGVEIRYVVSVPEDHESTMLGSDPNVIRRHCLL